MLDCLPLAVEPCQPSKAAATNYDCYLSTLSFCPLTVWLSPASLAAHCSSCLTIKSVFLLTAGLSPASLARQLELQGIVLGQGVPAIGAAVNGAPAGGMGGGGWGGMGGRMMAPAAYLAWGPAQGGGGGEGGGGVQSGGGGYGGAPGGVSRPYQPRVQAPVRAQLPKEPFQVGCTKTSRFAFPGT